MNLKVKWESTLKSIKKNEEHFVQELNKKIKKGEETPMDLYNVAYFSGLHNGFKFVWMMLDGASEEEFDENVKKILQTETEN